MIIESQNGRKSAPKVIAVPITPALDIFLHSNIKKMEKRIKIILKTVLAFLISGYF